MFSPLRKLKKNIEIAIKPTGIELQTNPIKIYYAVEKTSPKKRCGTIAE